MLQMLMTSRIYFARAETSMFRAPAAVALFIASLIGVDIAAACSRALWNDNGQAVLVGRNMDWPQDMQINLWAFPRGIARSGLSSGNSHNWVSKYGSVAVAVYDMAVADGINEKGLVANLLWLTESDYGPRDTTRPGLSLSLWAQYMLDNFATAGEAIAASEHGGFQIVPLAMPGSDSVATVHLSLADASGDSAVIEIIDGGKVRVHHGRQYTVMTNSPPFPQQLANLEQYEGFGGKTPLPGTTEAADHFVRRQRPPVLLRIDAEPERHGAARCARPFGRRSGAQARSPAQRRPGPRRLRWLQAERSACLQARWRMNGVGSGTTNATIAASRA
jgi:penicillin V acylase-like amidase (Ntn superfamily)